MVEKSYKALLIIDMLNDFVREGAPFEVPAARNIIENIAGEIRYAREKNRPVIYLCDCHEPDAPEFEFLPPHALRGTPGSRIIDELAPLPTDHIVKKSGFSGFYNTRLEELLNELEIEELLICGVLTNVCVLYTAVDAVQRGLRVTVPETCVAARDEGDHRFALRQINEVLKPAGNG